MLGLTNRLDFDFRWQDIYPASKLSLHVSFHVQFVSYLHLIVSYYWNCRKVTKKTFSFNHNVIKPMCSLTLSYPKGSTLKCKVMFQYIPSVLRILPGKKITEGTAATHWLLYKVSAWSVSRPAQWQIFPSVFSREILRACNCDTVFCEILPIEITWIM